MKINCTRVLLGGLAAGIIVSAGGIVLGHHVLGPEYMADLRALMPAPPRAWTGLLHLGTRMSFGFLAVFSYAAMRPRFGAGPRTAIIAGSLIWLTSYLTLTVMLQQLGVLTGRRLWISVPWTIGEIWIATLVGAWLYRERA